MNSIFENNLRALSVSNRELYSRLCGRTAVSQMYVFQKSRSGEIVPALVSPQGDAQPLHSMIDPRREAQRLFSTTEAGFLIFLGLGGGFAPEAALELTDAQVVVIDFCLDGIACLLSSRDYSKLFKNDRFTLIVDPSGEEIKNFILENYKPSLCGGIRTIPLRTRIEQEKSNFEKTAEVIQQAIEIVSADYSVQAHFGIRMFSNIIRNIKNAETCHEDFFAEKKKLPIREAAIAAAGPSLDLQLPLLAQCKSRGTFVISCDTALPVLLNNGIEPDAIVSIDCQHISYYHFLGRDLRNIPLVLDIASPPLLQRFSRASVFFSSGHPLARYACAAWRPFTQLDTSGGNVTYACLSLAEILGAMRITLFGADFSYVGSQTYARGTYIYPFFSNRQNRLSPLEARFSAFLYRSPFLPREKAFEKTNYYETSQLRFYRQKLEEKTSIMSADISCARGLGAPVGLQKTPHNTQTEPQCLFKAGDEKKSGVDFLEQYRRDIAALPTAGGTENYIKKLCAKDRHIFTTLLPCTAAVKKRNMELKTKDLIEEVKRRCIEEIAKVLG